MSFKHVDNKDPKIWALLTLVREEMDCEARVSVPSRLASPRSPSSQAPMNSVLPAFPMPGARALRVRSTDDGGGWGVQAGATGVLLPHAKRGPASSGRRRQGKGQSSRCRPSPPAWHLPGPCSERIAWPGDGVWGDDHLSPGFVNFLGTFWKRERGQFC